MRILVISDSHGQSERVKSLLVKYADEVHAVLHLGDLDRDLLKHEGSTELRLLAVAGNCDNTLSSPHERLLTLGRRKILMVHGNQYIVNQNTDRLACRALEQEADICLFGHTHIAETFTDGNVFYMNPGSITNPRDDKNPSYGLLTIDEETGGVSGEIIFDE
ncbi:MAG: metallophosphoesterase [Defluviitaleaceae bacterium]|nr:metallophosphoesterase [Defluviitaleaceae bacterium]